MTQTQMSYLNAQLSSRSFLESCVKDLWGENSDSTQITMRKIGQVEQGKFSGVHR